MKIVVPYIFSTTTITTVLQILTTTSIVHQCHAATSDDDVVVIPSAAAAAASTPLLQRQEPPLLTQTIKDREEAVRLEAEAARDQARREKFRQDELRRQEEHKKEMEALAQEQAKDEERLAIEKARFFRLNDEDSSWTVLCCSVRPKACVFRCVNTIIRIWNCFVRFSWTVQDCCNCFCEEVVCNPMCFAVLCFFVIVPVILIFLKECEISNHKTTIATPVHHTVMITRTTTTRPPTEVFIPLDDVVGGAKNNTVAIQLGYKWVYNPETRRHEVTYVINGVPVAATAHEVWLTSTTTDGTVGLRGRRMLQEKEEEEKDSFGFLHVNRARR